jgi:hypothetical protein
VDTGFSTQSSLRRLRKLDCAASLSYPALCETLHKAALKLSPAVNMASFFFRLGLSAFVFGIGFLESTPAIMAGVLTPAQPAVGTVTPASFWGQPYPYGYVYRRPRLECWEARVIDTPLGPREDHVWICGNAVTARY